MASFKCKDIGMKCSFEIKDENPDEMMKMINMHGQTTHNMKEVDSATMEKVKKAIKK